MKKICLSLSLLLLGLGHSFGQVNVEVVLIRRTLAE